MTSPLDAADPGTNAGLARQLAGISDAANNVNVRLGIVVSFNASTCSVAVSGAVTLADAAFMLSPWYRPCIGDTVVLLRYGASWLVLGAVSLSPANNLVVNGSFEIASGGPGTSPDNWHLKVTGTGVGTVSTFTQRNVSPLGGEVDGQYACEIDFTSSAVGGNSEYYVYCDPIAVIPGETYSAYAYTHGRADNFTAPECYISSTINMGWYADSVTTTPLSITGGQAVTNVNDAWTQMMCFNEPSGAIVPVGANFMRIHLDTFIFVPSYMPAPPAIIFTQFDRVVARKILNADGSLAVVPPGA